MPAPASAYTLFGSVTGGMPGSWSGTAGDGAAEVVTAAAAVEDAAEEWRGDGAAAGAPANDPHPLTTRRTAATTAVARLFLDLIVAPLLGARRLLGAGRRPARRADQGAVNTAVASGAVTTPRDDRSRCRVR
jgi:hypothetical protein